MNLKMKKNNLQRRSEFPNFLVLNFIATFFCHIAKLRRDSLKNINKINKKKKKPKGQFHYGKKGSLYQKQIFLEYKEFTKRKTKF